MAAVAVAVLLIRPWAGSAPLRLELSGDLAAHDPALVVGEEGQPWYVYSTGGGRGSNAPIVRRSTDGGHTWEFVGAAWKGADTPAWVKAAVPGVSNLWAPELVRHDGTWYLYYSASSFGRNRSVIGLMTGRSLDPDAPDYGWTDQGLVVASTSADGYNAIDPGVVTDADGTPWLFFGSFWGGIQQVRLEWPSGKPVAGATPVTVAARASADSPANAIEAPYAIRHGDWYYLFVSFDACCQGVESTYRIAVGRSRQVTGPFVDGDGRPMLEGGGSILAASEGDRIGPGGQSVSGEYLAHHFYDGARRGAVTLAIDKLGWTVDGWPVLPAADGQESP
ncbi:arabinan endo-1,5-alpha-L-arabinosidase [Propionicimonas sp.]|uniref:arabinan endo-1,5-alpha-L-arabinosidase n=1 Tax=Propionicimonas sp. TaxID=1955623 RepID=UPI003D0CF159